MLKTTSAAAWKEIEDPEWEGFALLSNSIRIQKQKAECLTTLPFTFLIFKEKLYSLLAGL